MAASGSPGWKDDHAKDRWDLVPTDSIRGIVKVLTFGAKKYGERNWENGFAWSRAYAALHRHLAAWWEGERFDPETGYSHLWHAGCCILFLIAFELRGIGKDDRPVGNDEEWDDLIAWDYDPRLDIAVQHDQWNPAEPYPDEPSWANAVPCDVEKK